MKRLLFLLLIFVQPAIASSPVWLVESAGHRLYLAGTIHLLRAADYPLPAAFDRAYRQSQKLAFETDIDGTNSNDFQSRLMQAVLLPPNQRLQDLITSSTLSKLQQHLSANKLSFDYFAKFKPSMLSMTLTLMELKKLGVGSHGVDQYFHNRAKQDKKQTLALESLQQQIDFVSNMGQGEEDLMLRQTLEEIETMQDLFSDMITSWRAGDTKKLNELFITPMQQEFNALYQQLLVQRNQNWIPKIEHYLQTPETEMVLVGCAHLIGKDGLIKHFRQAGYQVSQLD